MTLSPSVLELFAGGGGAAVGLRRAGFRSVGCVDAEAFAVATLVAAGLPGVHGWIGAAAPEGVPSWVPPSGLQVDLLWASAPCQPYSRVGSQLGAADPRDGWPATLAMVAQVAPSWVVVENVRGAPVEEWAAALERLGYTVSLAFLDAADWGLPSHRNRWFIVGGPVGFSWPTPTHGDPDAPLLVRAGRLPWVGFGAALWPDGNCDLPGEVRYRRLEIPTAGSRPQLLALPSAGVMTTEEKGTRANPGNGWRFNGGPDRASDSLFLATGRRRVTVREASALVGLEGHPWQGTKGEIYRQIGNVVAPVIAEALGRSILAAK